MTSRNSFVHYCYNHHCILSLSLVTKNEIQYLAPQVSEPCRLLVTCDLLVELRKSSRNLLNTAATPQLEASI